MPTVNASIADGLLEAVNASPNLSDEAKARFAQDVETYDRAIYDGIDYVAAVLIHPKYGSSHLRSALGFRQDPYQLLKFAHANREYVGFVIMPNAEPRIQEVPLQVIQDTFREACKEAGWPELRHFPETVSGGILSFADLLGSVPEYMREVMETMLIDADKGIYQERPGVVELEKWYNTEVMHLLSEMQRPDVARRVKDPDGEEHYERFPLTGVRVHFGRFNPVRDGQKDAQVMAYFCVEDVSPAFNPDPRYNWHLIEDSRVIYNGAICLSYHEDAEGKATVRVSTHH